MQTIETLSVKLVGDVTDFTSKMQGAMGAIQAVGDKMQAVGDRMQAIGQKWSIFVSAPIIAFGKSALGAAADFEVSMNVIEQLTGSTIEQMKEMSDQALQLGKDSVFSAGEVAKAQLTLAKAGMDTQQIMDSSAGVIALAAAADMELAGAAKVASDALNAFNLPASDAGKIADLLAAAANNSTASVADMGKALQMSSAVMSQYGFTAEETVTILAQMANAGIRNSDAGTSLKVAMMKLAAPTEDAAGELANFGVKIYDSAGAMRSAREIFIDFIDKLSLGAEQTVRVGGATDEMIKAYDKAKPAVLSLSNTIEEQQAKLLLLNREMAGVIGKYGEGSTQAQAKQLAIMKLTNSIEENQAKYTGLEQVIKEYNDAMASAGTETRTVTEATRNAALATVFGTDAVRMMNVVMADGVMGYDDMFAAVTKTGAAQEVADARMKGLAGAIEYFRGTLESMMIDTALPWLNTLSAIIRATADWIAKFGELDPALQRNIVIFAALAAALGPVLIYSGLIISSLGSIISLLAALNPWLVAASVAMAAVGAAFYLGADNLQILWKYLKGAAVDWRYMSDLIGWLPTPIQGVVQFLGKLIVTFEVLSKYIWGVITDGRVMSDLIGWLPTPIQDAVQAFGVFINRVREWVLNWRENLGEWLVILQGWAQAAWQWIVDAMPPVREKLLAWWDLMRGWLMDRLPEWMATLQGWATAAWQWIVEMAPVALAKLSEWTNALLGWVVAKLPDWVAMLLRWATAAITWIGDTIPDVIRGFGEWVRSIVGWGDGEGKSKFTEMIDRWIRILSEWVVNDLIPKIGPEIKKFAGALYNALVDMIASVRDAAWNIGVGIVQGMISGIQSMWNRLIDSARQLAGLAVTTAQDELEQHSPSRKGLAIGANFAESIGMGAREAMGQLSLDVTAGLRGALSDTELHYATVGAGGRGGGMPAIVLNQNFYGNVDRAAVASGSRDGILQGLRQVGLS